MGKSFSKRWHVLARFGRDRAAGPADGFALLAKGRLADVADHLTSISAISFLKQFGRERRAATALEFAMIGVVFFVLIFSVFVISIDLFWQLTLDDAVRAAARQVQIGNIKTGGDFLNSVCGEFGQTVPNCSTTLQYSVQGGSYFGSGGITSVNFGSDGNLASRSQFSGVALSSSAGTVFLLVQVAYPLPIRVLLLPAGLATENGTSSLYSVVSTVMEP